MPKFHSCIFDSETLLLSLISCNQFHHELMFATFSSIFLFLLSILVSGKVQLIIYLALVFVIAQYCITNKDVVEKVTPFI